MPSDISSEMLFDKRVLERNLRKGLVTQKDVDNNLKSLPDQTEGTAMIEARIEHHAMNAGGASTMTAALRHEEEEEID